MKQTLSLIATGLLAAGGLSAATFEPPHWAGQTDTEFSEWLNFSQAFQVPNSPDVAESTGDALLTQNTPGATITGTQNIYNPAGASAFRITDSFLKPVAELVLEVEASGTELDYGTVQVMFGQGEEAVELDAVREELSRITGGFGDTVLSRWRWDLRGYNTPEIELNFSATGPHCSLVSARLDVRLKPDATTGGQDTTAEDRWNYSFNATPGTRTVASTFQALEDGYVARHGNYVFAFDTTNLAEAGRGQGAYEVVAARVLLQTSSNFEIEYDPTYDSALSFLPDTNERYEADTDAGRPLELFGTGFRNGATRDAWTQTDDYSAGEGTGPTVYPVHWTADGNAVDASHIRYEDPLELHPFGIGTLSGTEAGALVPENAEVTFELDLSQPGVRRYLREGLDLGLLYFTATSLHSGGQGVRTFPEYHTRDSLIGDGPKLELEIRVYDAAPTVELAAIQLNAESTDLRFPSEEGAEYGIRWSTDLRTWYLVREPFFTNPEPGISEWRDAEANGGTRFYQVYLKP